MGTLEYEFVQYIAKFGKSYKPEPTFDSGGQRGWAKWYAHEDWEKKQLDKVQLYHNLHNGVAEDLITGRTTSDYDKFLAYARSVPAMAILKYGEPG